MAEGERLGASFGIDVTDLKAGLAQANRLIKESNSEFKAAAAGMDDWTKSEEGLTARIKSLNSITEVQREKVRALKSQYQDLIDQGLDPTSRQATELRTKINNEEAALKSNEKELEDQKEALKNLGKESVNAGDSFEKLGEMAKKAAKIAATAFAAASAAVAGIVKSSLQNYGDYEQLIGGVETLFGESADVVEGYANDAYKTAGMSANEYMETVTGFSASLLQSLGGDTAKAAQVADMAITDMADNANKMGTSMESIQNAYGGFAKQNFTMLDNLKLGYGGTQEEMKRLLADAEKLSGQKFDLSSYADIVDAIHIVQTEMGITGTTAKEASTTIQGSVASMKSAWQNLLTGIADENADVSGLTDKLVDSVKTTVSNVMPRIQQIISGILPVISEIFPQITPIIAEALPYLVSGATMLIKSLIAELPNILGNLFAALPDILTALFKDTPKLLEPILSIFEWITANGDTVIAMLAGIAAGFAAFKVAGLIMGVVSAIKSAGGALALLNTTMLASPITWIAVGIGAIVAATVLLIKNWDKVKEVAVACWDKIKEVWGAVGEWFKTTIVEPIADFFSGLWDGVKNTASAAWEGIKSVFSGVVDWFRENIVEPFTNSAFFQIVTQLAEGCWIAIKRIWEVVSAWFNTNVITPVTNFFTATWNTIKDKAKAAWDSIAGVWKTVSGWFTKTVITPVTSAFDKAWTTLKNGASKAWEGIKSVFSKVATFFGDTFSKAWERVKAVFSTGGKIFDGIKDGIVSAFKTVVNAIIKGINKVVAVPFNGINKALDKIRDIEFLGIQPFKGLIQRISVPEIPLLAKGGVVKQATNAVIGEDGAEAVVPLEKNTEWIDKVAEKLATKQKTVVVNQTNNYSQAHSRYELYKSKQQTAAAVRLALQGV